MCQVYHMILQLYWMFSQFVKGSSVVDHLILDIFSNKKIGNFRTQKLRKRGPDPRKHLK